METTKWKEDVHYCTSCGAANRKGAHICEECKREIRMRHRPVADFLKKRIKSKFLDDAKENLFSLLKDFLLSHLYGAVLTVSVIVTGAAVLANATPYIRTVSEAPRPVQPVAAPAESTAPAAEMELTESDYRSIDHVISAYDAKIDNSRRPVNTYWSDSDTYADASELFAENAIEGYTYSGVHELYENPITISMDELTAEDVPEGQEPYGQRDWVEQSIVTGRNVRSQLGQTLYADGYDVLEIDYYLMTFRGVFDYDFDALPPLDRNPYELLRYTFLLTRERGGEDWYIAEEKLVERAGV